MFDQGYRALSEFALKNQTERLGSLYPHLFITMSWNLFARSHSVAALMYVHFEWHEDSLVVTVPTHKSDQEGARVYPIHVYANPLMPELCPILSLAIYVFCMAFHREDESNEWKIFSGSHCEGKFSNWLRESLENDLQGLIAEIGAPEEIGTHSFR